jgi:dihydrofolate reductase
MARLVINNAMSVNGAFEAPSPDEWLVLDPDSNNVSLEQFLVADAMVLGRKTYEGLAAVWPQLVDDPSLGLFANRAEQHAQVCGVPDLARATAVERHPARR